ncbi:hypothetical protein BJV82DRAFT_675806 [Fennellomyces sp. T-0311]|nr:hypothetical protein BJV82DRAFT_675806 [Fennellomyces sp. T-0311]
MSCQVKNNPRYLESFGLVDREGLERLWSYLKGFVSITRQMSSERRILTLSHALAHFKAKRIASMASSLESQLKTFLENYPGVTDADLSQAWSNFVATVSPLGTEADNSVSNEALEIQYVLDLHNLYTASGNQSFDDFATRKTSFRKKLKDLGSLERILRSRGLITTRWKKDDEVYKSTYIKGQKRELDSIKSELRSLIVGRTMLEDLLHRQGKQGHKVTMRFKNAVKSVKEKANPLLKRYNDIDKKLNGVRVDRKLRAEEELIILQNEERRVKNYSNRKCKSLEDAIMKVNRSEGEKVLLYYRLLDAEILYQKACGTQWARQNTFVVPGQPRQTVTTFGDSECLEDDTLDERQDAEGEKEDGSDADVEISYDDIENGEPVADEEVEQTAEYAF